MSVLNMMHRPRSRRTFFRDAAGGAILLWSGGLTTLTACNDAIVDPNRHVTLDLRTERGVLNYWYALAQLENDFYARLAFNVYPDLTLAERVMWFDFQSTTNVQYTSLQAAIPGRISDALLFDADPLDLSDRMSVFTSANLIADTVAGAYAAAAPSVTTPTLSALVTPFVDEAVARANAIRGMLDLDPLVLTPLGPSVVMETLDPYFLTTFTLQAPEAVA